MICSTVYRFRAISPPYRAFLRASILNSQTARLAIVLDKLPTRLQPKAKRALHEIIDAPTCEDAQEAMTRFAPDYGAKYPKAVASLQRDADKLLTFFDFPAKHWVHLRTVNPVESAFATVRLGQRVTKGAGSAPRR